MNTSTPTLLQRRAWKRTGSTTHSLYVMSGMTRLLFPEMLPACNVACHLMETQMEKDFECPHASLSLKLVGSVQRNSVDTNLKGVP